MSSTVSATFLSYAVDCAHRLVTSETARKWPTAAGGALILSLMAASYAAAQNISKDNHYVVVQAVGIRIALHSALDMNKPLVLKKGQSLVLKTPAGQMVEVDGPYQGKPLNHYIVVPDKGATMGYESSSPGVSHCPASTQKPGPSGGPNPDEVAGSENQARHCK